MVTKPVSKPSLPSTLIFNSLIISVRHKCAATATFLVATTATFLVAATTFLVAAATFLVATYCCASKISLFLLTFLTFLSTQTLAIFLKDRHRNWKHAIHLLHVGEDRLVWVPWLISLQCFVVCLLLASVLVRFPGSCKLCPLVFWFSVHCDGTSFITRVE